MVLMFGCFQGSDTEPCFIILFDALKITLLWLGIRCPLKPNVVVGGDFLEVTGVRVCNAVIRVMILGLIHDTTLSFMVPHFGWESYPP